MTPLIDIVLELKRKKHRITKARKALLQIFIEQERPLSVDEIRTALTSAGISINKTTVYRELEFLCNNSLVEELQFNERKKRYELNNYHHHHLVCEKCFKVEEIDARELEKTLTEVEKNMAHTKRFGVVRHALEFTGLCIPCSTEVTA